MYDIYIYIYIYIYYGGVGVGDDVIGIIIFMIDSCA